jgi:LPXTG-site transpeptidase (sortase) family protein
MRRLGLAALVLGFGCLCAAALLLGSSSWAEYNHERAAGPGPTEVLPPSHAMVAQIPTSPPVQRAPTTRPTAQVTSSPTLAAPVPRATATPTAKPVTPPTLTPTATPSPSPDYGPARWIRIPSIGLENQVVEVGIKDGVYEASWWDVGHQSDSPDPGQPGNSIFNGHVATINAGHVFRNLKRVQPGDSLFVYSESFRTEWSVTDVFSVSADSTDFMAQTAEPEITLYTCDGRWSPRTGEFSERLVVVARFVTADARE